MATFFNSIKVSFLRFFSVLRFFKKSLVIVILMFFVVVCLPIFSFILFQNNYHDKIYPNIYIDGVNVGGLTRTDTLTKLKSDGNEVRSHLIEIAVDDINIASHSDSLNISRNWDKNIEDAFLLGRENNLKQRFASLILLAKDGVQIKSSYVYSSESLMSVLEILKEKVDIEGLEPFAELKTSNNPYSLTINPGKDGRELEMDESFQVLLHNLSLAQGKIDDSSQEVVPMIKSKAVVASTSASLTQDEIDFSRSRALKFVGKTVRLKSEDKKFQDVSVFFTDQNMIGMMSLPKGFNDSRVAELLESWREEISRPAQDAKFDYDPNTLKVNNFSPHKDGIDVDVDKTGVSLYNYLAYLDDNDNIEDREKVDGFPQPSLYLLTTSPEINLEKTNDLGIKELIGFGESYYSGSIASRVFNVGLTSERINLTIVAPNQEFSFNKTLGEVSAKTGFKPAYIIKNGMTELGDGGGVCQVSTTLFRALLDGGLNITRRRPHSYRVGYYEQHSKVGLDATVYTGEVDLRFVNDTPNHLLIYSQADSVNRYMKIEIYGTSDGRTTEIVDYKTWDARPPLPPVYIPDPSLPAGKTQQIDWSAPGLKTSFVNVIRDANGEVIREDTYYSNYRPWSAKYLQGI